MESSRKDYRIGCANFILIFAWIIIFLTAGTNAALGSQNFDFFEKEIRPLLIKRCYECHSHERNKSKGNLYLDSRKGWSEGGDLGPAIHPGDPERSLVAEAVRYANPDLQMPPDGKLPESDIQKLIQWIQMGAPDPRESPADDSANKHEGVDLEEGRQFWAFQPVGSPAPPDVHNEQWPWQSIDRFILAELERRDMAPVEDAEPLDLVRRLHFDLTGLPPDVETLDAFAEDPSEEHYRRLVDRLLASERFGEKWGRHWLDLARYAESTGGGRSSVLANAWRYRNYAIDAYNRDKPFDRFVREQIAGDLLPHENDRQRAERLIATAYLALGPKNLDLQDKELLRMNTVDEQIDTVGKTFLGMTLGCARCHDHKFDPVPAKDYYALAGIFRSTRTLVRSNVSTLIEQGLPVSPARVAEVKEFQSEAKRLEAEIKELKKSKEDEDAKRLKSLETELKSLKQSAPPPLPEALSVTDEKETGDYRVCIRGNVHALGDPVPRGFLQAAASPQTPPPSIPDGQSGRVQLADWLVDPGNPLTARVYVNRVWHHLFGAGLVRTVDNFGAQGERPSHPELLDFLARTFMDNGWSTKKLIRALVLSRTYRLSSQTNSQNLARDPESRLRWRMERRRLNAEAIRDAVLLAGGQLRMESIESTLPSAAASDSALNNANIDFKAAVRQPVRSVYIPVFREEGLNDLMEAFDFANPSFTVGQRSVSTLPTQSLYLMNSDFIAEQSRAAAARLLESNFRTPKERLDRAFKQTLSRPPSEMEETEALKHIENFPGEKSEAGSELASWASLYQSLFSCVDFRYLH